MHRYAAVTLSLLTLAALACASDFSTGDGATYVDVRRQVDATPAPDLQPTPPCRQTPPADGCPCAYKGRVKGVCARGRYQDGQCQPPDAYTPNADRCDALDNDCDGKIDEDRQCDDCLDEGCEIERIDGLDADGSHVLFWADCPSGEKAIVYPVSRAERDGGCWRVQCWDEVRGKEVWARWCSG